MAIGRTNFPGGGTNTSDATAAASDIVSPKTAYIASGKVTGTVVEKVGSATVLTPSTSDQAFPAGRYGGSTSDGKVSGDSNLAAGNIKNGTAIFGVTGTFPNDGTAAVGDVLSGKTFYNSTASKATGTMTNKVSSATVLTPTTTDVAVPQGYYGGATGDGKVSGDANLVAGNIKSGTAIFGVTGTLAGGSGGYAILNTGVAMEGGNGNHLLIGGNQQWIYSNGTYIIAICATNYSSGSYQFYVMRITPNSSNVNVVAVKNSSNVDSSGVISLYYDAGVIHVNYTGGHRDYTVSTNSLSTNIAGSNTTGTAITTNSVSVGGQTFSNRWDGSGNVYGIQSIAIA